jgi:CubicO group peptidase (beta-lactamase class C family)
MNGKLRSLTLLTEAIARGVFPGAVLLVARSGETVLFEALGNAALLPSPRPMSRGTVFDLASLTKPLATALSVLGLASRGELQLDAALAELLPGERIPEDRRQITLRQLLSHCSGLPAWMPYYLGLEKVEPSGRRTHLRQQLLREPLEYAPGTGTVYSDLGYLLIEWILEQVTGLDLHRLSRREIFAPLGCTTLGYRPLDQDPGGRSQDFAATENCPWRGRILNGQVHDENAYVLGGVAGHSGLFGTAADVKVVLDALLDIRASRSASPLWSPRLLDQFLRPARLDPASTWTLGFDTPAATGSSAGRHFSAESVGHLGFTGTSFWLDLPREIGVILLTNRVHPTRANREIRLFRPLLHDAVMGELGEA